MGQIEKNVGFSERGSLTEHNGTITNVQGDRENWEKNVQLFQKSYFQRLVQIEKMVLILTNLRKNECGKLFYLGKVGIFVKGERT